jgi:hypothetical protein
MVSSSRSCLSVSSKPQNIEVRRLAEVQEDIADYNLFAYHFLEEIPKEDGQLPIEVINFTDELRNEAWLVFGLWTDGELAGVVKFARQGLLHFESHVAIRPFARGKVGLDFVKFALWKLREAFPGPSLIVQATIPWTNKKARAFVKALGGKYVGCIPFSWVENNTRYAKMIYVRELV